MNRKYLIVLVVTLLAAGMVMLTADVEPIENGRLAAFPFVVDDWTGVDVPMGEYVYRGLETPYVFMREYRSPRFVQSVNLVIVWFDDRNLAFHTPEACLEGMGNTVTDKGLVTFDFAQSRYFGRLMAEKAGGRTLVIYFFDQDGHITTSQTALRLGVLKNRLLFRRCGASFVRLVAPLGEDGEAAISAFLESILEVLPRHTHTHWVLQGGGTDGRRASRPDLNHREGSF